MRRRKMDAMCGKKNGLMEPFRDAKALPDTLRLRETWSYSHIMHKAAPSWRYIVAAGAFVYSIYRNNQSHEQYAKIYRLYENSGAYMRTYKNTFVVNYWSFRINFCYIPRNLLLFDQVNVQLLRYVAIASTAINDIYHCDVYCDVWIWLYVYIVL